MTDDGRTAYLHRLQRTDTERLTHTRHDIDIAHREHLLNLLASHESGEVELVGYAAFGYEVNHLRHLVAATGHDEAHSVCFAQHARCGFHEVLGTFLHRDTAEEGHQLVLARRFGELLRMSQRLHGIVHRAYLARVLTVFLNHRVTRQIAHAYDMVRFVHTAFLDGINGRIDITATAVEVRSVNVYHERLAADLLGKHACRISQPVVTVNDVEVQTVCQHRSHRLVVAYLFNQVVRITARETDTAQVVRTDTTIVVTDTVAQTVILLRTHPACQTVFDIVIVDIFPYNRHAVGTDDAQERLILVAPRLRNDECDL